MWACAIDHRHGVGATSPLGRAGGPRSYQPPARAPIPLALRELRLGCLRDAFGLRAIRRPRRPRDRQALGGGPAHHPIFREPSPTRHGVISPLLIDPHARFRGATVNGGVRCAYAGHGGRSSRSPPGTLLLRSPALLARRPVRGLFAAAVRRIPLLLLSFRFAFRRRPCANSCANRGPHRRDSPSCR